MTAKRYIPIRPGCSAKANSYRSAADTKLNRNRNENPASKPRDRLKLMSDEYDRHS